MKRAKYLIGVAVVGSAGLMSVPGFGQEAVTPQPVQRSASPVTDIVVTGSRILRQDYSAPSPIVTLGKDSLTQTPSVTVESTLDTLPQFTGSFNSTSAFPGNAGQANLNLRGLGTNRVLVAAGRSAVATDQRRRRGRCKHFAVGFDSERRNDNGGRFGHLRLGCRRWRGQLQVGPPVYRASYRREKRNLDSRRQRDTSD